jgi:hypothetical protein
MHPYFERIISGQPIYESDGIRYLQPLRATGEPLYEVNLVKLDKEWGCSNNPFYLELLGDRGKRKVTQIKDILAHNAPLDTPEINISKDGKVSFTDGRHRFFVLKSMAKKTIIVTISESSDFSHVDIIDGKEIRP